MADMQAHNLIGLLEEHYHTFWQGDLDDIDRQLSTEFVDGAAPEGTLPGPAYVKEAARQARVAFPDMQVTIDSAIVAGNTVAVRATWRGTHTGPMGELEATGNRVEFSGIVVWTFDADRRIAERCEHVDMSEFRRQLQA